MVTSNYSQYVPEVGNPEGKLYIEGSCLSSDVKPTVNICNGSKLVEIDTATVYIYDEENHVWEAWR